MITYSRLFFFLLFCICWSCDSTVSTDKPNVDNKPDATSPAATDTAATSPPMGMKAPLPEKHDCKIEDTMLEDNQLWMKEEQTLVGIVADKITKSIDFGDSHRIFVVMDTRDCKTLLRETLPVNTSPDYPYYLNANTYEATNKVICTQGFEGVFCYDAVAKKMLPKLEPRYLTERDAADAQSGLPAGQEMWGHYLISNTMDFGSYVYDLSNKETPKAILPNAEFQSPEDGSFSSLFLLEEKEGVYQALLPTLNEDQDGTEVKKLFKQALAISTNINKSVRNNRFIVLKEKNGDSSVAIDMQEMVKVELPEEVAGKSVQEILEWLKKG